MKKIIRYDLKWVLTFVIMAGVIIGFHLLAIKNDNSIKEENIIVNNDDLNFTIKSFSEDKLWETEDINVLIENKTDKLLFIHWNEVCVNGYMIDPYWGTSLEPHSKINTTISFYKKTLEKNNIQSLDIVQFTLTALDEENWDIVYEDSFTIEKGQF